MHVYKLINYENWSFKCQTPTLSSILFSQVWGVVCYRVCFSQSLTFCSLPCPSLPSIGKIRKKAKRQKGKKAKRQKGTKAKKSRRQKGKMAKRQAFCFLANPSLPSNCKERSNYFYFFPLGKFFIAVFTCAQTLCQYNLAQNTDKLFFWWVYSSIST